MRRVADQGFPVPAVHDVDGTDLIMDRIDGDTMLDRLSAAPWKVVSYARLLARLQQRLARIEAPTWMLAEAADRSHPQSVLHLDMHPMNVIMSPDGPVVIDWTNAAGGPPGFDGALTYVEVTRTQQRLLSSASASASSRSHSADIAADEPSTRTSVPPAIIGWPTPAPCPTSASPWLHSVRRSPDADAPELLEPCPGGAHRLQEAPVRIRG